MSIIRDYLELVYKKDVPSMVVKDINALPTTVTATSPNFVRLSTDGRIYQKIAVSGSYQYKKIADADDIASAVTTVLNTPV